MKNISKFFRWKVHCKSQKLQGKAGTGVWCQNPIRWHWSRAYGLQNVLIQYWLYCTVSTDWQNKWSNMNNERRLMQLFSFYQSTHNDGRCCQLTLISIAKFFFNMWIWWWPVCEALPDGLSGWWNQRYLNAQPLLLVLAEFSSWHSFLWFSCLTELNKWINNLLSTFLWLLHSLLLNAFSATPAVLNSSRKYQN